MQTIGDSMFQSCTNLFCINFYGKSSPTVSSIAFSYVPATTVMTSNSYQSTIFGPLNVTSGTTIDECLPPTLTFTKSNTFTESNAFIQSNTFSESNMFTTSLHSGASFQVTLTITHSLSLTQLSCTLSTAASTSVPSPFGTRALLL